MLGLIIVLGIYTVIILFFVPLEKIGKAQTKVKDTIKKMLDKANN
jgi:hypothetical protein